MSQAGRYAHEQNTKRHAQRGFNQPVTKVAETIETAYWMSPSMDLCRDLATSYDNSWSIDQFVAHHSITIKLSMEEGERRLRYLAKLGFLRMSVHRVDGEFKGYRFGMVDVNLPK